jgi:hypothetical protein
MALDTRLRRTLNIGLGSGSTLEATASHPELELLDCVEINPAVARGVSYFAEATVLADPRVRLVVDDASYFLLSTPERYDLIVSDGKQAADYSGNAKLLSRDFYLQALARMAEHAIFVQWIPLGTLHEDFRIVVRTFADVFPEVEVFYDPPDSVLLVGSRTPIVGRPRVGDAEFRGLRMAADLERFGIPSPEALLARWVASRPGLVAAVGPGPLATWNHTTLEFSPYKAVPADWAGAGAANLRLLLDARAAAASPARAVFAPPDSAFTVSTELVREAFLADMSGDADAARRRASEATLANAADGRAAMVLERLAEGRDAP